MKTKSNITKKASFCLSTIVLATSLNAQTIHTPITYDTPGTHNVELHLSNVAVDPDENRAAVTVRQPSAGATSDITFNLSDSSFDYVSRGWLSTQANLNGTVLSVVSSRDSDYNLLADVALTIDNTTFTNNSATAEYQAFGTVWLAKLATPVIIKNSTFSGNTLNAKGQVLGGAIVGSGTKDIIVSGSRFENNVASAEWYAKGGAIHVTTDLDTLPSSVVNPPINLDVSNSVFIGNKARAEGAQGGAISKTGKAGGVLNITNTTFTNNEAIRLNYGFPEYARGGAIVAFNSDVNFVVNNNTHILNTGNVVRNGDAGAAIASGGGFLFVGRESADFSGLKINFDIENGSSMTIGTRGKANEDSIATNGDKTYIMTKTGEGLLTVNGSMEYFYSSVHVEEGRMEINGGLTALDVVINEDAVLSFGEDARVNRAFVAEMNSELELYINNLSNYVQIAMDENGNIYIENDASLTIIIADDFNYAAGHSYMLFLFDEEGTITGSFDNVSVATSDGGRVISSDDYVINYLQDGDIQGIELLFIPEPANIVAIFGLIAIAFALYRRRK